MRRNTPVRRLTGALAVAALSVYVGLAFTGSAAAFNGICTGAACHGSGTHTFGNVNVCVPGVTVYFVDSFLRAKAQNPHVTSFHVTPAAPCTGATVSAPTVDPWPASKVDPDRRSSGVPAGQRVFRIGWTVNVPSGSKPIGAMKATWSIAWTEPTDTTGTTFKPPEARHDFVVQVMTPPTLRVSGSGIVAVKVIVSNDGPDASPVIPTGDVGALVFRTTARYPIVMAPAGCTSGKTGANCGVRRLALHETQSFLFGVQVDLSNAHFGAVSFSAKINLSGCHVEESTCLNNLAYVTITPR